MTLKRLKDIEYHDPMVNEVIVEVDELKKQVIKWIKEDTKKFRLLVHKPITKKWMDRFNITEEDLK